MSERIDPGELNRRAGGVVCEGGPSERGFHYYEGFIRCPRLHAKQQYLGEARDDHAEPLVRGILVHLGAGQWRARRVARLCAQGRGPAMRWAGRDHTDPSTLATPRAAMEALAHYMDEKHRGEPEAENWLKLLDLSKSMVHAVARANATSRHRLIGIERQIKAILPGAPWFDGRFVYTQRLDWGSESSDGTVRFIDTKAVGRITRQVVERYTLSGQFLGYAALGRKLYGSRFRGVSLELVEAVKKKGSDEHRVKRERLPLNHGAEQRWFRDLAYHESRRRYLHQHVPAADWPGVWTEHMCGNVYGRPCPAYDECRLRADLPDDLQAVWQNQGPGATGRVGDEE